MEKIVAVSTDISGLEGKPENVVSFYQDLWPLMPGPNLPKLQLEVIAWKHSYKSFQEGENHFGFRVAGWHGPVGVDNWWVGGLQHQLKNRVFNVALVSVEELLELGQPPFNGYLLIHEAETDRNGFKELIKTKKISNPLLLENVPAPGSILKTTAKVIGLRQEGVNTGLMIDLGHLLLENPDYQPKMKKADFLPVWDRILLQVRQALTQMTVAGLHLPIGTLRDCLPMVLMDEKAWQKLASLIHEFSCLQYLTIENVHRPTLLRLTSGDEGRLKERTRQILQTLVKTQVIR